MGGCSECKNFRTGRAMTKIRELRPRALLPVVLGTLVEYYDYALYGLCAASIAYYFFPAEDPTIGLMKAYGVFAVGAFAKPVGSVFFGFLGDFRGRKFALQISMLGVAVPTMVVAYLPEHTQWGAISTVILIACRFFQGFFGAGEADGVSLYIYEHVDRKNACFANSMYHSAAGMGVFLASYIIAQNYDFGLQHQWRTPFLLGGLLGIGVLICRQFIKETPEYVSSAKNVPFKIDLKLFASVVFLIGSIGGMYQFSFIFFCTYLVDINILSEVSKASIVSTLLLVFACSSPFMGVLADKIGHGRQMIIFGTLLLLCTGVNMFFVHQGEINLLFLVFASLCLSGMHTPGFVVLVKHFPVKLRYRYMSIGHSFGSMLFSGPTPFIALSLYQVTSLEAMPLVYFAFLVSVGMMVVVFLQTRKKFAPTT